MSFNQNRFLWLIFILSLISTIWSLYYGYFWDFVHNLQTWDLFNAANALIPCNMCRYIRVFTYPIVFISLIGILRKDPNVSYSIMTLSIVTLLFCVYKYLLEMKVVSMSGDPFLCTTSEADCSEAKPLYLGFISLALLWGIVQIIIMGLCKRIMDEKSTA